MKIIDIRIECDDDKFDQAWAIAEKTVQDINDDLWWWWKDRDWYSVDLFDASEEAQP